MASLNRVRVSWTNFPGAPGLSTFYLAAASTNVAPILTFFTAIKDLFPNALTIVVPNSGDVIDTGTNQITGAWVGSGGGTTSSTATANPFSGTSGALVRWQTGAVLNGRRVTGRTYLVPLNNLQYANDGSLSGTCVNAIQTAAAALITALAPNLRVYGPPRDADPDVEGDLGKPAIDAATIAAIVPDLAVVMRSRRT